MQCHDKVLFMVCNKLLTMTEMQDIEDSKYIYNALGFFKKILHCWCVSISYSIVRLYALNYVAL